MTRSKDDIDWDRIDEAMRGTRVDVSGWTREQLIADLDARYAEAEAERKAGTLKTAEEVFAELDRKFGFHEAAQGPFVRSRRTGPGWNLSENYLKLR